MGTFGEVESFYAEWKALLAMGMICLLVLDMVAVNDRIYRAYPNSPRL
jgi:uncharacterized protein (UPF0210 family)